MTGTATVADCKSDDAGSSPAHASNLATAVLIPAREKLARALFNALNRPGEDPFNFMPIEDALEVSIDGPVLCRDLADLVIEELKK